MIDGSCSPLGEQMPEIQTYYDPNIGQYNGPPIDDSQPNPHPVYFGAHVSSEATDLPLFAMEPIVATLASEGLLAPPFLKSICLNLLDRIVYRADRSIQEDESVATTPVEHLAADIAYITGLYAENFNIHPNKLERVTREASHAILTELSIARQSGSQREQIPVPRTNPISV